MSDSPSQGREINHSLAGEVQRLRATFVLTVSLEVPTDTAERAGCAAYAGNGR